MKTTNDMFGRYKDETGEDYLCPINAVSDDYIVSEGEVDNCVESSTTERYSGNLRIANRKIG